MTTPDTKAIRENMEALGGGTTGQRYVNEPKKMELIGRIHRVLNPENCSAEFVLAWDRPEAGGVDETDEDIARLIAAGADMRETILALCERCRVLEEALSGLEWACDQLASTRTHEVYLAMIDSGQADALLSLDARRQAARAVLAQKGGE